MTDVCGVLVAGAGAAVLAGWLTHTTRLVRLHPDQVPVQVNTALAFVALGVALLLARRSWRAAIAPATLAALVGWLTVAEHVLDRSLGIDTLVYEPWLTAHVDVPGRMALNAALALALLGTALLAARRRWGPPALGLASSLVAALGLVALFGYASGVSTAYAWRSGTAMAPLTATVLVVAGAGFGTLAYGLATAVEGMAPRWLPVPIGLGTLAATLCAWQALAAAGSRGRAISADRAAGATLVMGVALSLVLAAAASLAQATSRDRKALVARTLRDDVLREAYAAVALADDLDSGFARFGEALARAVPFDRVALTVIEGGTATIVAVTGVASDSVPVGTTIPVADPSMQRLLASHETTLVNDAVRSYPDSPAGRAGMNSYVSTPVVIGGSIHALLTVSSLEQGVYDADTVALVGEVAALTGGSLYTLARLGDELRHSARLRELDQLKNEFVGVVAHDLRSPMTVIAGYVDTVLTRWDAIDDPTKRELLGVVTRNVKRLSVLVEDVLQVARIESGDYAFDVKPFDLARLVRRTVDEMNAARPDKPVHADVPDGLPAAFADEDRQWQVLTNLLSNAQKFSPKDSPVDVRVAVRPHELAVSVVDRGPGIQKDDLPRLFGKFARLGSAPGGEKGTGLGLYICKALVEAQRGTISAESEVGRGTTMTYTVPRVGSGR